MVTHIDWAAHLDAVDDMVLRSGTLRAAADQIRRLQGERSALLCALVKLVQYERGHDYHHDRVGALHAADMALNQALGDEAWPI